MSPLLSVRDLRVTFATDDGQVRAVDGVSFDVNAGEVLAIVGESGCGKSVTAQTLMGLTRSPNATITGSAMFDGRDLNTLPDNELQKIRGARIAMVFQDPMTSLNPVYRVGDQIAEAIRAHRDVPKARALEQAVELLEMVGIPNPQRRVRDYPHEFSGGMRQRVMIAMALALEPELLIADEPTTALDVTIQAQILDLLRKLNREQNVSVVLITHDLGVVAELADRVVVMYAGQVVEQAGLEELFATPCHPYTRGLLDSIPRLDGPRSARLPQIPGHPPSLLRPPDGCRFAARCPDAVPRCAEAPPLVTHSTHQVRCWNAVEVGDE
jgi:peptide/nickel transport system ATP-binding protein